VTALFGCDVTDSGKDLRIDLSSKFFAILLHVCKLS
jgi:hypothetical protein